MADSTLSSSSVNNRYIESSPSSTQAEYTSIKKTLASSKNSNMASPSSVIDANTSSTAITTEELNVLHLIDQHGRIINVNKLDNANNNGSSVSTDNIETNSHIDANPEKSADIVHEIKNHIDLKVNQLSNDLKFYLQSVLFGSNIRPDVVRSSSTQNNVMLYLPINSIEGMEQFEILLNQDELFYNETVSDFK